MRTSHLAPVQKPYPLTTGAAVWGAAFVVLLGLAAPCYALALAQAQTPQPAVVTAPAKPAVKVAQAPAAKPAPEATKPAWAELTAAQKQALAPLAGGWNSINEAQKRKWLALSRNFGKLPPAEQATMHSRMTEWVALSPQQRTRARLNFAETKQLAPDDKKAKWEAYQALPPEEKSRLAAGAVAKPPATAAAVTPVPPQKLATVPKPKRDTKTPRIAAAPHQVDHQTLLPQPVPAVVPAPNN